MKKSKKVLLKIGEGLHSHIMECKKEIEFEENTESITLNLKDLGIIVHDEHDSIKDLPKGKYESTSQVEYDPFLQNIRNVYD